MKLTLKRIYFAEKYTIGKLYIDGVYFCDTLEDKYRDLSNNGFSKTQGPNDVNAVASAYVTYQNKGIERIIGGSLSFSNMDTRPKYVGVVERGLTELGKLLEEQEVL